MTPAAPCKRTRPGGYSQSQLAGDEVVAGADELATWMTPASPHHAGTMSKP